MSEKTNKEFTGLSRQAEEEHLQEVLAVVRENLDKYSGDVAALRKGIEDMQAHFHDDNPELINELENSYTMYNFLNSTLARNERAMKKPYFGRIDFHDEKLDTQETFYIGRSGIFKDVIHPMVIDWRAPVANIYYENGLGKCSYPSAEGEPIGIDLKLKRTYELEDGKLQNIFDTETIANDDILTKYLSKNKQAVLGEIVATIQKEQNEIIRKTPLANCLVQGVAGSGKTTVAMHRISYILYNYAEKFKPEDFYIVGSNRLLLNYITGVLPDLDVYGVRQMTMEELFVRLLYEDWDKKKYRIKGADTKNANNMVKGRLAWFKELEAFCGRLERKVISRDSVYLNPKQFVEGFVDGKAGVHDRTGGEPGDPRKMVLLIDGGGLDEFLAQYPTYSIQSKINLLNERLVTRIKDEFTGKGIKYTSAERKAILKAFRGRYGGRVWKKSIFTIYKEFLEEQRLNGYEVESPDNAFDVYDLAALAYLYKRVKETEEISEAHHIVIDEAQDFGMMVYSVLKYCIKDCTYTIMGDVSQNIHFGYGLNDWEELKSLYINDTRASFGILKKSYRNTVEISNFATKILHHGKFAVYPVEPIIRHGSEPIVWGTEDMENLAKPLENDENHLENTGSCSENVESCLENTENCLGNAEKYLRNRESLLEKTAAVCREWQRKGLETIAVICRNEETAKKTTEELGQFIKVKENNLETAEFGNGIMVLPVEYTKGLEFDAVLILDPTREEYPVDDGHAKLLYVAATRALHELCVLHSGNLTGLIADPVPEESVKLIGESEPAGQVSRRVASEPVKAASRNVDSELSGVMSRSVKSGLEKRESSIVAESSVSHRVKLGEDSATGKVAGASESSVASENVKLHAAETSDTITRSGSWRNQTRQLKNETERTTAAAGTGRPSIGFRRKAEAPDTHEQDKLAVLREKKKFSMSGEKSGSDALNGKAGLGGKLSSNTGITSNLAVPSQSAGKVEISFGSMPDTNLLRARGHAKTDQTVRWVTRRNDGLYLQSAYGILRISPVARNIIRLTFAKGSNLPEEAHPGVALKTPIREWMYRDSPRLLELKTDDICLQVEKSGGNIHYMTRDNAHVR